jgi:hypothetical protein
MITLLRVAVDAIKAASGDSDFIWYHVIRIRLHYNNGELCDYITLQYFSWVCVHHIIHSIP